MNGCPKADQTNLNTERTVNNLNQIEDFDSLKENKKEIDE